MILISPQAFPIPRGREKNGGESERKPKKEGQ